MSPFEHCRRPAAFHGLLVMLSILAGGSSCSAADFNLGAGGLPSTQNWVMIDDDALIGDGIRTVTNIVIDKGGAISQGSGPYSVDVTANCRYNEPLSGNWSGTAVHITSSAANCGAIATLTMDGTAADVYGTATTMSGTYRLSVTGPGAGVYHGTWKASFSH